MLSNNQTLPIFNMREFSLKMRKVREKQLKSRRVKKYKMKTNKATQKRIRVCGGVRNKMFKYFACGKRHLNRNKSKRNLRAKRRKHFFTTRGNIKHLQKLLPYYKKSKFLKC